MGVKEGEEKEVKRGFTLQPSGTHWEDSIERGTSLETAGTPEPPRKCPSGPLIWLPTSTMEHSGIFRQLAGQPFVCGWHTNWAPNYLRSASGAPCLGSRYPPRLVSRYIRFSAGQTGLPAMKLLFRPNSSIGYTEHHTGTRLGHLAVRLCPVGGRKPTVGTYHQLVSPD